MPRSGTTLLESILASHDDITAGDELTYFTAACDSRLDLSAQDVSADIAAAIRAEYEEKTAALFAGKSWLIDKLPHNFKWAEVISKVFPDARILHCHRDPMDNCWSIFRTNFEYTHNYSFSMKSIGQFYAHYQKLMSIYESRIGDAMLAVNYDALVQDPAAETARIFEFLGLEASLMMLPATAVIFPAPPAQHRCRHQYRQHHCKAGASMKISSGPCWPPCRNSSNGSACRPMSSMAARSSHRVQGSVSVFQITAPDDVHSASILLSFCIDLASDLRI